MPCNGDVRRSLCGVGLIGAPKDKEEGNVTVNHVRIKVARGFDLDVYNIGKKIKATKRRRAEGRK